MQTCEYMRIRTYVRMEKIITFYINTFMSVFGVLQYSTHICVHGFARFLIKYKISLQKKKKICKEVLYINARKNK